MPCRSGPAAAYLVRVTVQGGFERVSHRKPNPAYPTRTPTRTRSPSRSRPAAARWRRARSSRYGTCGARRAPCSRSPTARSPSKSEESPLPPPVALRRLAIAAGNAVRFLRVNDLTPYCLRAFPAFFLAQPARVKTNGPNDSARAFTPSGARSAREAREAEGPRAAARPAWDRRDRDAGHDAPPPWGRRGARDTSKPGPAQ